MRIENSLFTEEKQEFLKYQPRPFIIIKPDGSHYLPEITQTLEENRIQITEVFFIKDWEAAARAIYEPQLKASSQDFNVGFETHIWLTKYLFGNCALLLLVNLPNQKDDLKSKVIVVQEIRNQFRKKFSASTDGTFVIAVNLDRLVGKTYRGADKRKGILGTFQLNGHFRPLTGENLKGQWDNHYFKYIHTPGNLTELRYEWETLITTGIIEKGNRIEKEEWRLLQHLRCLIPPSKSKGV